MLGDVLDRVERRLRAVDMAASAASTAAGLSEDAIRNMRRAVKASNGRTGVTTTTITALAPILKTTVGWLLSGTGDEESAEPRTVPIVGYVGAGSEAHYYASGDGELDEVEAPEGAAPQTVGVLIRGESMGPLLENWLVFYDDVRSPITEDLFGRVCVVGLANGKVLIKLVQPSRTKGFYHLLSNAEGPMLDQEVNWAARVKTMRPR